MACEKVGTLENNRLLLEEETKKNWRVREHHFQVTDLFIFG